MRQPDDLETGTQMDVVQHRLRTAREDLESGRLLIGAGHDSLFIKYSEAPVTVLAVKDKVLGHNPLAAIYTAETCYRKLLYPEKE